MMKKTLRYGPSGTVVSHEALSAFRRSRDISPWVRTLKDTHIVTFGRDFAVANTGTRPTRTASAARARPGCVYRKDGELFPPTYRST